ncbi:WhiB family transcriptional regulator [Pseudonocardia halophobica]
MSARPACTLESAHLFDPSDDEHPEGKQERAARLWAAAQVCDVCPVKSVCLDMIDAVALAAPTTPDGAGVWAGHLVTSSRYRAHPAVKVEDPNRVTCFKCHETKPREEFGKGVREWTSTEYLCKKCGAAKQAEWAARKRAEKQARRVA